MLNKNALDLHIERLRKVLLGAEGLLDESGVPYEDSEKMVSDVWTPELGECAFKLAGAALQPNRTHETWKKYGYDGHNVYFVGDRPHVIAGEDNWAFYLPTSMWEKYVSHHIGYEVRLVLVEHLHGDYARMRMHYSYRNDEGRWYASSIIVTPHFDSGVVFEGEDCA
jgi:hypothetical protein